MSQQRMFKRRDFLRILGVSSVAGVAALKFGWNGTSEAAVVSDTRLLMGTVVNLTLVTQDREAGEAAISACMAHMTDLESVLSRHMSSSQLSMLNRDGSLQNADSHLIHLLQESKAMSSLTGGAFDVTIKPLVDLYQDRAASGAGLPTDAEIEQVLTAVGDRNLVVDGAQVSFSHAGMGVTLDGIAKGYIVDQGVSVLREYGFDNVLVEAGGDLSAIGQKGQDHPWQVGIRAPRAGGASLLGALKVGNQAVATSGDYMQTFTQDFSAHHILDPRVGYSAPELASATLVAATGMQADALATAVMVMGPVEGLALVESLPDCEAFLVGKDQQEWRSSGFVTS